MDTAPHVNAFAPPASDTPLDWALAYAAAGMAVFPVKADKKPLAEHGVKDATVDEAQIRAWWTRWPHADPAWAVPANNVVLDLDMGHGADGLKDFFECVGVNPDDVQTPQASTPRGGRHLVYAANGAAYKNGVKLNGAAIDVRTAGGYIVLPGPGNGRAWLKPLVTPLALVPDFVPERSDPTPVASGVSADFAGETPYARAALEDELAQLTGAAPGERNQRLNRAAFSLGQLVGAGVLEADDVERRLFDAAIDNGLVADDGESSVLKTIQSGLRAGLKRPRDVSAPAAQPVEPASAAPPAEPANVAQARLEVLDVGDDDEPIPPRQWLLGNAFCREFVSGLISPGAGAKTSLRLVQALSLSSGRSLTGEHVFVRSNVLFVCFEDGMREARRRVRAAMIHHMVSREDVKGRLFLTTPTRMKKMAQYGPKNSVVEGELDQTIRNFVDEKKIDLVIIDPIKKAHAVEENSNDDMDAVITIFAALAVEKNIAVDVLSHERKGSGEAGDVNRARGAGSMKDGGRLMYTNTWMTDEEAKAFNVSEDDRRLLFRVDSAKVNLVPPSATAQWFKLVGVKLENGDDVYTNGDEVQTVEPWKPPGMLDGFSTADLNKAIDRLRAGMGDGRLYSAAPSAKTRAAWRVLHEICPAQTEERCRKVIATWVKNGVLTIGSYRDEKERKELDGITGAKNVGAKLEWGG